MQSIIQEQSAEEQPDMEYEEVTNHSITQSSTDCQLSEMDLQRLRKSRLRDRWTSGAYHMEPQQSRKPLRLWSTFPNAFRTFISREQTTRVTLISVPHLQHDTSISYSNGTAYRQSPSWHTQLTITPLLSFKCKSNSKSSNIQFIPSISHKHTLQSFHFHISVIHNVQVQLLHTFFHLLQRLRASRSKKSHYPIRALLCQL